MTVPHIELSSDDAFLLAAGLLLILEPDDLTVEQRLHAASRNLQAKELCTVGRYHRLMSQLHWIAYGKRLPPLPENLEDDHRRA